MTHPHLTHSAHSHLIKGWRAPRESMHVIDDLLARERAAHRLKSPIDGYAVRITFTELDGDDRMVVRSTNWRSEDEPHGIFPREHCRKFWKDLTAAGFVAF